MNAPMGTLPSDAPDAGLVLDGRTIGAMLESLRGYCAEIPFEDPLAGRGPYARADASTVADSANWAHFFFQNDQTPDSLAALYADADTADGTLPAQQAFLLAFFRMLETPRALLNRLPAMHRDLYYRDFLGLRPHPATADQVVVAVSVDAHSADASVPAGTLFDAGQDSAGHALQYALDEQLLANHGRWTDLRWSMPASDGSGAMLVATLFDEAAGQPWPAAGARLFGADASAVPAARGVLAGSPLLAMSSGTRTVSLHFAAAVVPSQVGDAFVSGADAWLPLTLQSAGDAALTDIVYVLSSQAAAACAPTALEGLEGLEGLDGAGERLPLLKLLYTGSGELPAIERIDVSVEGVTDVAYATDDGADKTGARSYPFGNGAVVGSSFALAAGDWYGKAGIDLKITVRPEWIDLPPDGFPQWYDGYPGKPADNAEFTVQAWLASAGAKQPAATAPLPLFEAGSGAPKAAALAVDGLSGLAGQPADSVDPRDWPQWLRFELTPKDFLSREYQQQVAAHPELNQPYVPQVASLAVSWSASMPPAKSWQLTPFGYAQTASAGTDSDARPMLYLGFADVAAGEDLSLYWNLRAAQPLDLTWQYLNRDNEWASLDALVNDGTGALFRSAKWWVALPHDAGGAAWQMPSARLWIRAALTPAADGSTSYPWLNGLLTNAGTATLQDAAALDAAHFDAPLPAGTIARTVTPLEGVSRVEQPWPSFGGRPAETEEAFNQRIAQRLLHRDRALTWNDMAMLLREGFPEVMTVQLPSIARLSILPPPRQQVVVVVPASGASDNDDPLRPGFGAARLADMQTYLQSRASLWMDIVVANPQYREVKTDYEVVFTPGTNPDFGYRRLKEELAQRYMPWSLAGDAGAVLGNRIDYYDLVAWIEQRPYVSSVVSVTLDGEMASVQGADTEVLILSLPERSAASSQGSPS